MTAKMKSGKIAWTIIKYASLLLMSFIAVVPVVSCVITALKTPEEYAQTNVMEMPQTFYLGNFKEAFVSANMLTAFMRE